MNVGHYLALNGRRHPEKLALTHNDRTYTYGELNRTVNRAANGLRELGIKRGEKVALMSADTDAFPIGSLCPGQNRRGHRPGKLSAGGGRGRLYPETIRKRPARDSGRRLSKRSSSRRRADLRHVIVAHRSRAGRASVFQRFTFGRRGPAGCCGPPRGRPADPLHFRHNGPAQGGVVRS